MSVICNKTPVLETCANSSFWAEEKDAVDVGWIVRDLCSSQIPAPQQTDVQLGLYCPRSTKSDFIEMSTNNGSGPLREKNYEESISCKHVPHKDKPPQTVARRNARERRRVEAVNAAFLELRKVVPIQNVRGKRISKVKTLHHAIEYIHALEQVLEEENEHYNFGNHKYYMQFKNEDYYLDNFHLDEF